MLHYASDGRVLSGEVYYDQLSMLAQLGHVAPPASAADSLEPMVQRLFAAFDSMDIATMNDLTSDDAQGIDELARRWLRGRDAMIEYLGQLKGMVSDVRTTYTDYVERISGDTAVVTCWLDQDDTTEGQRVHISAPTTIAFTRVGMDWRVSLVHTIPLPPE